MGQCPPALSVPWFPPLRVPAGSISSVIPSWRLGGLHTGGVYPLLDHSARPGCWLFLGKTVVKLGQPSRVRSGNGPCGSGRRWRPGTPDALSALGASAVPGAGHPRLQSSKRREPPGTLGPCGPDAMSPLTVPHAASYTQDVLCSPTGRGEWGRAGRGVASQPGGVAVPQACACHSVKPCICDHAHAQLCIQRTSE